MAFRLVFGAERAPPPVPVGTHTDRYLNSRGHILSSALTAHCEVISLQLYGAGTNRLERPCVYWGLDPRPSSSITGHTLNHAHNGKGKNEPISKTRQTALPRASGPLQRHLDSLVWLSKSAPAKAAKGPSSPEEPLSFCLLLTQCMYNGQEQTTTTIIGCTSATLLLSGMRLGRSGTLLRSQEWPVMVTLHWLDVQQTTQSAVECHRNVGANRTPPPRSVSDTVAAH